MALTKWNKLKGKGPGYRIQGEIYNYETMKGIKNMEREITQKEWSAELVKGGIVETDAIELVTTYDFDKCEVLQRENGLSCDGECKGRIQDNQVCNMCPHYIINKRSIPIKVSCKAEDRIEGCLENEIFMKLYDNKHYDLNEGIELLKRVIGRLETIREQNAVEAIEAFMYNYCGVNRCSDCMFMCVDNTKCLAKLQIAQIKKGDLKDGR